MKKTKNKLSQSHTKYIFCLLLYVKSQTYFTLNIYTTVICKSKSYTISKTVCTKNLKATARVKFSKKHQCQS